MMTTFQDIRLDLIETNVSRNIYKLVYSVLSFIVRVLRVDLITVDFMLY